MESNKEKTYSRSALADALDLSLKEVTEIMINSGWILPDGDSWQLTAKGEFEGGSLKESKKYGSYLVWPGSVLQHPVFQVERDESLSASDIAKSIGLSARLVNLVLQHCGWLKRAHKGWEVTAAGTEVGGVQHENPKSGVPWVAWQPNLLANDYFQAACVCLIGDDTEAPYSSINGIQVTRRAIAAFLSWCYLSDVVVAQSITHYQRPGIEFDFYLPKVGMYVDIWDATLPPQELAARLERPRICRDLSLDYLPLEVTNLQEIEQEMPRELLKRDYEL